MKIVCYLPYDDYNENSFDVNDDYYDSESYEKALRSTFEAVDMYQKGEVYQFDMYNTKVENREEKVHYSSCNAMLYNSNGDEETVEGLVSNISLNEPYVCMISFDYSSIEEEFEYDLKTWLLTFNKIDKMNLSDEYKFANQPRKTMKVKFVDDMGFDSCVDFVDCRIVSDEEGIVMVVDKIIFNKCD